MRNTTDLVVDHGIIHLLAPKGRGLVLSERELDLGDAALPAFFEGHISRGLQDPQTSAATFVDDRPASPFTWVADILADPASFIGLSQRFAEKLFDVMSKDTRISDGTLAVVTYRGTANNVQSRYLALLKLDPSDAFTPVHKTDDLGRTYIALQLAHDIMPTIRERLHKSAFVGPSEDTRDYDLLVLDRQTAAAVARFFLKDFLGAELAYDDKRRTEDFYRALRQARSQVASQLRAEDLKRLDDSIGGVMAGRSVNLNEWTQTLPLSDELRRVFEETLGEAVPDRQFRIDEEFRNRFAHRRRFKGDNNLVVQIDARFFEKMIDIEDVRGSNERRIIITTQQWEEAT